MPCCGILLSHRRRGPGPHGHRRHGCRGAVSLFADLRWQHVAVPRGGFSAVTSSMVSEVGCWSAPERWPWCGLPVVWSMFS